MATVVDLVSAEHLPIMQAVEVAENTPLTEPQEEAMAVVVVVAQAVIVQVLPPLALLIPEAVEAVEAELVPDRQVVYKVVMVDQEWLLLGILLTQAVQMLAAICDITVTDQD